MRVTRGKVDSIVLYEVTEDELQTLEHGPANATYFNFAIALIPLGVSLFVTIFTVTITSVATLAIFFSTGLICLLAGVILLIVWYRTEDSAKGLIRRIRERVHNTEYVPDPAQNAIVPAASLEDGATLM